MAISGGCLCGAVRFRIEADEALVVRACWCRLCQYLGGGSSTVDAGFPKAGFVCDGEISQYESIADSGNALVRSFCPACGTPLFSEAKTRPHLIFARVGTLDEPERFKPQVTIWTSQAPSWACIDQDLPQVGGQPPPAG